MKKISIEIADTPSLRERGLMHRKILGKDDGMLFQFPEKRNLSFWMQNTYIPLDIAFINDNGGIIQISEMNPLSTRLVTAKIPCRYALEVNRGWFRENDIGEGDKISNINNFNKRLIFSQFADPNIDTNQVQQEETQEEQNEVSPNVELVLNNKEKVRHAEDNNLALQIVYKSRQSGKTLPPRKLHPISRHEKYPMGYSEGGAYFTARDVSPDIDGGDWIIGGNQIKRFLFDNIISLEVLEEFVP